VFCVCCVFLGIYIVIWAELHINLMMMTMTIKVRTATEGGGSAPCSGLGPSLYSKHYGANIAQPHLPTVTYQFNQ